MVSFRRLLDKKQVISRHQVQSLSDALSHHLADVITVNQTCSLIFNEISHFSTLHQTGAPIVRSHGLSWSLRSRCARGSAFGSGLLTGSRGVGTRGSQCCRVACAWVANSKMRITSSFMVFLCLQAIAHVGLILARFYGERQSIFSCVLAVSGNSWSQLLYDISHIKRRCRCRLP